MLRVDMLFTGAGFVLLLSVLYYVVSLLPCFKIGIFELILSMLGTGIIVVLISMLAVMKPLHTEPAKALRK